MLAIVEVIRMWRPYLLGKKFYIEMNKKGLKYFLEQYARVTKIGSQLLGYEYEITYSPRNENCIVDALSRHVSKVAD